MGERLCLGPARRNEHVQHLPDGCQTLLVLQRPSVRPQIPLKEPDEGIYRQPLVLISARPTTSHDRVAHQQKHALWVQVNEELRRLDKMVRRRGDRRRCDQLEHCLRFFPEADLGRGETASRVPPVAALFVERTACEVQLVRHRLHHRERANRTGDG